MHSNYLLPLKARASATDTAIMKLLGIALVAVLAIGSTACNEVFNSIKDTFGGDSPTSPSDPNAIRSYLGNWAAATGAQPGAQGCAGLQWTITSQSGSQFSGDFSAACPDGVNLAGTLNATHGEATIPFAITGTASKAGITCPFSMTGTGTFQGTSNIALVYAGTSACLGSFSGTETIRR